MNYHRKKPPQTKASLYLQDVEAHPEIRAEGTDFQQRVVRDEIQLQVAVQQLLPQLEGALQARIFPGGL